MESSVADPQAMELDELEYLELNPDVAEFVRQGLITAEEHWRGQGSKEGRPSRKSPAAWASESANAHALTSQAAEFVGQQPPSPPTLRGSLGAALLKIVVPFFRWYTYGLRGYIRSSEERAGLVQRTLRALARDMEHLGARALQSDNRFSGMHSRVDSLDLSQSALEQEISKLKQEISNLSTGTTARLNSIHASVQTLQTSQARQQDALDQKGLRIGELESALILLQSRQLDSDDKTRSDGTELSADGIREKLTALGQQIQAVATEHRTTASDIRQQVQALANEHRATTTDLREVVGSVASEYRASADDLRRQVQSVTNEHRRTSAELREFVGSVATEQRAAAEELRHQVESIGQQLQSMLNEYQASVARLESEGEATRSGLAALSQRRAEIDSAVARLTSAIDGFEGLLRSGLSAEHRAWVEADEQHSARVDHLIATIESVKATAEMLVNRVSSLEAGEQSFPAIHDFARRIEEFQTNVGERIEQQNRLLWEVSGAAHSARRHVIANDARIGVLVREMRAGAGPESESSTAPAFGTLYSSFEDIFRGTREEIRDRLRVYLPVFQDAGAGTPEMPILDLGCGRGEWLELLRESGLSARGVDLNPEMVERSRAIGLEIVQEDAIRYLRGLPDASLGAVTTFHMVEHLPFDDVMLLISESLRVLKPKGVLLFETPNPNNLFVGARNFRTDPTHRHPLPCGLMRFVTEALGFSDAVIREVNPLPESLKLPDSSNPAVKFINDNFFGPQDYSIIARKY